MTKHLRLLETLRHSSNGLKAIADVIDQAVKDIEKIEEPNLFDNPESDVIMSELGDMIDKIQKDRDVIDGSIKELPKPTD
jgi:hypothetical protein